MARGLAQILSAECQFGGGRFCSRTVATVSAPSLIPTLDRCRYYGATGREKGALKERRCRVVSPLSSPPFVVAPTVVLPISAPPRPR